MDADLSPPDYAVHETGTNKIMPALNSDDHFSYSFRSFSLCMRRNVRFLFPVKTRLSFVVTSRSHCFDNSKNIWGAAQPLRRPSQCGGHTHLPRAILPLNSLLFLATSHSELSYFVLRLLATPQHAGSS